jgi:hypothetical protein
VATAAETAVDGVRGGGGSHTRQRSFGSLRRGQGRFGWRPRSEYPLPLRGGQRGMAKGGLGVEAGRSDFPPRDHRSIFLITTWLSVGRTSIALRSDLLPKKGCGESSGRSFSGAFKRCFLEGLQRSADQARVMSRMRNPQEWSRFVCLPVRPLFVSFMLV